MFHQATLGYGLQRATIAGRRAELRALHHRPKKSRWGGADRFVAAPRPAACCA
jgi:hypothetical protein